jgi:hypothetical protein
MALDFFGLKLTSHLVDHLYIFSAMTISQKINKPHHPPVYMNETIIESHQHLGLFFS